MRMGSLLSPPEQCQFNGAKRLPALSDIGPEAKRFCTQPGQISPENLQVEFSNGYNSWGGIDIPSSLESGNTALLYQDVGATDRSTAVPPDHFGGLRSFNNTPAARSDTFLVDFMPAWMCDTKIQSSAEANGLYPYSEFQDSTNNFGFHHPFHANKTTTPNLHLGYEPNFSYNGDLLENRIPPNPCYPPFTESLSDDTSTWIDFNIKPENGSGYQQMEPFESLGYKAIGVAPNGEGFPVLSLDCVQPVGTDDTPETLSTVLEPNIDSSRHYDRFQSVPPESAPTSVLRNPIPIDTCFGVIITHTTSCSSSQGMKLTPVTLNSFGDIMTLSFQDSRKYAGILALPVLCKF
ncbi:hypothetical protein B0O99DRAFT_684615 [Bisporella sp. PMI_857]|nr:hypothetical protein B0O99DRAFT_684615 [Bisporella sp. PMI_857]